MTHGRVALRYAEALFLAAVEGKAEEKVYADLMVVQRTVEQSRELAHLLKSPVIKRDMKQKALRALFEGAVGPVVLDFLALLAEKGREDVLPVIIRRFVQLRNEKLGILVVEVSAATELSGPQQASVRDRFASLTGKTIQATFSVDKALIGGFRARVGDTVFDGTIKRQLELMRQRFLEGNDLN